MPKEELAALLTEVGNDITHAKDRLWWARRGNGWLAWLGLTVGVVSAAMAAISAAIGDEAKNFFGGWQMLCVWVAILTAVSTWLNGWHKLFAYADRTADAEQCLTDLKNLSVDIEQEEVERKDAVARLKTIRSAHQKTLT